MATIVPPPVMDRGLQMALMGFAQPFGQGLAISGQNRLLQEDLAKLRAFQQGIPAGAGTIAAGLEQRPLAGLNITPQQFPQLRSRLGQQVGMGILQQQFQTPLQQAQAEYYRARAAEAGRPPVIAPPTIAQQRAAEARRIGAIPGTPEFERIAEGPPTAPVPRAPTAFEQTQKEIERISAIPKDQRTVTQQARLDQLLDRKPVTRAGALQVAKEGDETGLPAGTVFQADPQGNIKIISEAGGVGLGPADKTKLAVTQAKEFRADPRIKNFQIIERSERGMQAALKQATSPNVKSRIASDQALGVLFQKMLDPESVVRESEFARTPEGAAAINRLLAIAPQLRLGGLRLLDEDRLALVTMAQKLLNEAKISANRAFDEFETRADEIGLNKKIIFGGAKKFSLETPRQFTPANQVELNRINREIAELESRARTPARRPGPWREQPIPQPPPLIPGMF